MRRAGQDAINKPRHHEFYPTQLKEATILTDGLLQNPQGWDGEFRR